MLANFGGHFFILQKFKKGKIMPMTKPTRELSTQERRSIRKLVARHCANHDSEYGCLPLECECPMLGICYTNSAMCRYFREAVLPNDPELETALQGLPTKRCQRCGKPFPVSGRRVYCSDNCAEVSRKEQTAARVRKFRSKAAL